MKLESWLAKHPYLQPLADFHAEMESVLAQFPNSKVALPEWDSYRDDFFRGVPLLRSRHFELDVTPAEHILKSLVVSLTLRSGTIAEQCRTLQRELDREPDAARLALRALLDRREVGSSRPGLLRFLGWTVLSKYLQPMVFAFSQWRDDEKWLRSYCPTCGANAVMAQLQGAEQGRRRFLHCGRCSTFWQYRRTGCPFCTMEDDHSLRVLAVAGEGGLRIDYCEHCRGYLKTYAGQGDEGVLLANWTSIHLDSLAQERALRCLAEPIYSLGCPAVQPQST